MNTNLDEGDPFGLCKWPTTVLEDLAREIAPNLKEYQLKGFVAAFIYELLRSDVEVNPNSRNLNP